LAVLDSPRVAEERLIGYVAVDSAQLLVLDPVNLPGDAEPYYQRVVAVTLDSGGGEVKFDPGRLGGPDGVAAETQTDGRFPVYVAFNETGQPTQLRVVLIDPDE